MKYIVLFAGWTVAGLIALYVTLMSAEFLARVGTVLVSMSK